MSDRSRRRPWLAAVLALVVSGLGHAYLRRWARAFGWYAVITATVVFLVPDSAVEQIFTGKIPPIDEIAPVLVVVAASVIDAYIVAIRNNRAYERQATGGESHSETASLPSFDETTAEEKTSGSHRDDDSITCPACGREADPKLDFCQWCATPLEE